jgi:hypothetical protein
MHEPCDKPASALHRIHRRINPAGHREVIDGGDPGCLEVVTLGDGRLRRELLESVLADRDRLPGQFHADPRTIGVDLEQADAVLRRAGARRRRSSRRCWCWTSARAWPGPGAATGPR